MGLLTPIFPWPRAACDAACGYVLDHRQSGDGIVFNNWESEYYLRHETRDWLNAGVLPNTDRKRVWYISTSMDVKEREDLLRQVPAGWHHVERREFRFTIVELLERSPSTSTAGLIR